MHYLYAVNRCEEATPDHQEGWWLVMQNSDRAVIERWLKDYRYTGYQYKLVTNPKPIKDCFYVAMELRRQTETSRFLKKVGYTL